MANALKRSLFGYTVSSVDKHLSVLKGDFKKYEEALSQKIERLETLNRQLMEELERRRRYEKAIASVITAMDSRIKAAEEKAEREMEQASQKAREIIEQANAEKNRILESAKQEAEKILSEAREKVESAMSDAKRKAEARQAALDAREREIKRRTDELCENIIETERDYNKILKFSLKRMRKINKRLRVLQNEPIEVEPQPEPFVTDIKTDEPPPADARELMQRIYRLRQERE